MVGQTEPGVELDELLELVHSACHQIVAGTGKVNRAMTRKALSSLGHALGFTSEAGRGARNRTGKADLVWHRDGGPAVAFAIDRGLRVSLALALMDTGAPQSILVVASGMGDAWQDGLEAFRRAAIPSREGALANAGIHVVLLNIELDGDYVVEAGDHLPMRHFAVSDLLSDPAWEDMGWLVEQWEAGSSVEMGGGASRDFVDRAAYPLFPHKRVRKGQLRFLDDVHSAIEEGGLLVAHAPTGIGKTASALVPAVQHALDTGRLVMFLTPKQSQHRIAIETLRSMNARSGEGIGVVDVIAKQAMCPRMDSGMHHAAFHEFCRNQVRMGRCRLYRRSNASVVKAIRSKIMHVHELRRLAKRAGVCPHKAALDAAAGANVMVCDYNYVFVPELAEAIVNRMERGWNDIVLVVDEAHNLPDRAREAASGTLTQYLLERAAEELKGGSGHLRKVVRDLTGRLDELSTQVPGGEEMVIEPGPFVESVEAALASSLDPMGYEDLVGHLKETGRDLSSEEELAGSAVTEVATFLEGFPHGTDTVLRTLQVDGGPRLNYRLLDPSVITRERFDSVHAAVLMSGTLWPVRMYADLLGLDEARMRHGEYRSPFPPGNRLVLVTPGLTSKYTSRGPEMYARIAGAISDVLRSTPGNVAVFAPSYAFLGSIRDPLEGGGRKAMGGKDLLVEERGMGKRDREALTDRLEDLRSGRGGVLMGVQGGSLSEGVDYIGNLLSAVVVVGLPLAPPSKEVDALVTYFDGKFGKGRGEEYGYINPAMNRVVQAAGRLIRTEKDRGVVVLMDERFLHRRYLGTFPPDWTPEAADDLGVQIDGFFEGGRGGG
jgi:DNA excision repair protein ERCC-2